MGIRVLMGAIMLIAFSIILLVPAGAQSAFAGLSVAPTCTIGNYNADSNQCEAPTTVAPTCPASSPLNTSTDMCEGTTTVAPTCPAGAPLNTSSDLCEGVIPSPPSCDPGFNLKPTGICSMVTCEPDSRGIPFCEETAAHVPFCDPGNYNLSSNQCELSGSVIDNGCASGDVLSSSTSEMCVSVSCGGGGPDGCTFTQYSPICDPGLKFNSVSDLCDIAIFSPTCSTGNYNTGSNQCEGTTVSAPTCSTGNYNTGSNLCEATTTSTPTCPDGFTLNTSTDLCESPFEEDPGVPIGGTLIPIDSASLFLVGAQMTTSWLIPVIIAGAGIVLVFVRKSENS